VRVVDLLAVWLEENRFRVSRRVAGASDCLHGYYEVESPFTRCFEIIVRREAPECVELMVYPPCRVRVLDFRDPRSWGEFEGLMVGPSAEDWGEVVGEW